MGDGTPEPAVGPAAASGVSSAHQVGILTLGGDVPWEWLAGCRTCGAPHVLRPDLGKAQQGIPWMTWDAPHDGHPYAPRLTRHVVDVLMVEHRAGVEPAPG